MKTAHRISGSTAGVALALLVTALPAGAASSPAIDVLGSYFPAWLFCMVAGVVLTIVARLLFLAMKLDPHLWPKPLVYPCLAALFAMTAWLVLFRN